MQLAGINEWIASLYSTVSTAASGAVSWAGDEVSSKLAQWRNDVAKFRQSLVDLQASPSSSASGVQKRNDLITRGQDIASKVDWIEEQLTAIGGFFGLSGLGVLPFLVPAVIVAAIAAVTIIIYKWTDEVAAYLREERLVSSGVPRDQAQQSAQGPGLFGDLSKLIWPIVLVGGGLLFLQSQRGRR